MAWYKSQPRRCPAAHVRDGTVLSLLGLWRLMTWLPWAVDALLAAAACMAFAYFFERGEVNRSLALFTDP